MTRSHDGRGRARHLGRLALALALLAPAGCGRSGGSGPPESAGHPTPTAPVTSTAPDCPPPDARILELVRQGNHGQDVPGMRITARECVAGYVVASLDSPAGGAVALLRPTGSGYAPAIVGSNLCGAPEVEQAPAEVRARLRC